MVHPLIGRDEDLSRLAGLCRDGAAFVTVWGAPGIGKTRLAAELCVRDLERAGQPIEAGARRFCDLAAANDAGDVCAAVARALDIAAPAAVTAAGVGAGLRARGPSLLVLDNFEQVAPWAAETVGAWSAMAPHSLILVTSRERLRLAGEVVHEVEPLGLPEAARLFCDRVALLAPRLVETLDPDKVGELVRRLEGIPLAIELASARADVLSLDELLARLDAPLDLLGHAPRDFPPHHETLRRALQSSFRLLSPVLQGAFARCAIFRGGFSLEAAAAVLGADLGETAPLEVLQALRDKALLRRCSSGGATRFALFEAARAFAEEALASLEDVGPVRERHARHYLEVAVTLAGDELANLAEAVAYALEQGETEAALGALVELEPARLSDALLALLERALAGAAEGLLRARSQRLAGRALQLRGRLREARAALTRALALADAEPTGALTAALWTDLGLVHHQAREMEDAQRCYEKALALHRAHPGERRGGEARCLGNLGALFHDVRRYEEALDHYTRALAIFHELGERRFEGIFLTNKGVLLAETGATAEARTCYQAALDHLTAAGERRLEAITRTNLGNLYMERGELELALACHEAALAAFRDVTDPRSEGLCLGRLGMVLAVLGRDGEARQQFGRAERLLGGMEDPLPGAILRLYQAFLALGGGEAGAREVRARLTEAHVSSGPEGASLVDLSDDARSAVRLLSARLAAVAPSRALTGAPTRRALIVGPDASWFTPPGRETQDLRRRRALRRLLGRLVDQHRAMPGQGVTLDGLRAAGWPGERLLHEAAVNRVHVALSELRRLGLRDHLQRRGDRYLIDPELPVELADN